MNTTRVGKIGRLPKAVRDVLGDRLEAGEPGGVLVEWLNGLTSVQEVLGEYFGGRPISEQNLSEWRQGGHEEWLRHEAARVLAQDLAAQSKDLILAANGKDVSEFLARRLSLVIVRLSQVLLDQETDPAKQWERVCSINRELSRLRRDDHRAAQLALDRRRLDLLAKESGREMQEAALGRFSPAQSRDELWSVESDAQERREEMREAESCPSQSPTSRETAHCSDQKAGVPGGQTVAGGAIAGPAGTSETHRNPTLSNPSTMAERESGTPPPTPSVLQPPGEALDGSDQGEDGEESERPGS